MQYKSLANFSGGLEIPSNMICRGPLLSIDTKLWAQRGAVWELEEVEVIYCHYIHCLELGVLCRRLADCSGGLEIPSDMISRGPLLSIDTICWALRRAVWELEGVEVIYCYYIHCIELGFAVQEFG